ncbi:MAG: phosphatidate cytidylyltransferase [Chloroherpetonaceae bacterium]|nr:phosphatidate cytidylyltransferase [Chloroherpetonaceae bacterium]MCS7212395.1 phosphatidate cytidylyltransferase [Chloroherpetonaceae bacterium]MDW8020943.1 phosphatidate cytidylyltransferase [Chloroherpetonaceae bacterium]
MQRIVVAAIFGPLILFSVYTGGLLFLAVMLIIAMGILYEMMQIFRATHTFPIEPLIYALGAGLLVNAHYRFFPLEHLILASVVLLAAAELFHKHGSPIHNVGAGLLAILYAPLCLSTLLFLRQSEPLGSLTMIVFLGIWAVDTAAYFGGKHSGGKFIQAKFFARHSPNKTWEGFLLGLLSGLLVTLGLGRWWLSSVSAIHWVAIGLIVGVLGALGDLVESMFKRESGLKDSSHLIPGHGGFFDRFDSLCLAAPAVFLYAKYVM